MDKDPDLLAPEERAEIERQMDTAAQSGDEATYAELGQRLYRDLLAQQRARRARAPAPEE